MSAILLSKPDSLATKPDSLCADSIGSFQEYVSRRGRSANTVKGYGTDLRMLLQWTELDSINSSDLEERSLDWLNATRDDCKPGTTQRRINSLRAFGAYVDRASIIQDYIAPTRKASEPHPLPGGMKDVYSMIGVASTSEERALVALCGLCGLRVSEAVGLWPKSIDWPRAEFTVRGKGDKERLVPMSSKAMTELASVSLAASIRGDKLISFSERTARSKITILGERARVTRRVASHDLRATFATSLYLATKDIALVAKVLGHSSVTTTQIYIEVANDLARKGVNLL